MLKNYVECSNIGFSVWGGGHAIIYLFIITLLFIDFFFFPSEILCPSEFCARCDRTAGTAHATPLPPCQYQPKELYQLQAL